MTPPDEKALSTYLMALCDRAPGLEPPAELKGPEGSVALQKLCRGIHQALYLELPLNDEERQVLEQYQDVLKGTLRAVCMLSLGADLIWRHAYKRALATLAMLGERPDDKSQIGTEAGLSADWQRHLSAFQRWAAASGERYGSAAKRLEAQMAAIYQSKFEFESAGQWRTALWWEVRAVSVLRDAGRLQEAKWLEEQLKGQAAHYGWAELEAQIIKTVGGAPVWQSLFTESDEASAPVDEQKVMSAFEALVSENAFQDALDLGRIFAAQFEQRGDLGAAIRLIKAMLRLYDVTIEERES